MPKTPVVIYQNERGNWKIRNKHGSETEWIDEFDTEEEASTYAMRNGAKVEGCND